MMLAPALLLALAEAATAQPAPPREIARAQVTASVRIVQAAEIRDGLSDAPHRRRTRVDELGNQQILLEFE